MDVQITLISCDFLQFCEVRVYQLSPKDFIRAISKLCNRHHTKKDFKHSCSEIFLVKN